VQNSLDGCRFFRSQGDCRAVETPETGLLHLIQGFFDRVSSERLDGIFVIRARITVLSASSRSGRCNVIGSMLFQLLFTQQMLRRANLVDGRL
jgi:hypothetical protein